MVSLNLILNSQTDARMGIFHLLSICQWLNKQQSQFFLKHWKRNQKTQLDFLRSCCYFETCDKQLTCSKPNSNCQQMKNTCHSEIFGHYIGRCQSSKILFVGHLLETLNIFHRSSIIHKSTILKRNECVGSMFPWPPSLSY